MAFFATEKKQNKSGFFTSPSSNQFDFDSLNRQIENANMRIADAGYKPQDTDKRWGIEKALNLPQGQNWFFDTLEILGRPGNAIKNVIDKSFINNSQNVGQAFGRGLAGKDKVSGTDLAAKVGTDNKVGRFLLGTALDIGLDPVSYIPGGVIAKGAKTAAKTVATPIKAGYNAIEQAFPKVQATRQTFQDGLGYAFKPGYKETETLYGTESNFLKDLKLDTESQRRYLQENALDNVLKSAKETGIDAGSDVGRIMEAPLKNFVDAEQTISNIIKGKPMSVNIAEGELPNLISEMNSKILNSPLVKKRIEQRQQQLKNIEKGIKAIENHPNPTARMVERLDDLNDAHVRVSKDLDKIGKGIHFDKVDDSVRVVNPKRSLYQRALGDMGKFIDDISPKGSFDKVVSPEFADTLRPIATELLQEGTVSVPGQLKGTPQLKELRRLFQGNLDVTYNKKSTKIKINQRDPDKMYFQLQGHKPVIPESLTDAGKRLNSEGLQFNDVQFTNKLPRIEIPRPVRELSSDPKIQESAQRLTSSNDMIRQLAKDNGIEISELEGYMTHVLSQAERDARKAKKTFMVDRGRFGTGNPNKKILNERELMGSAEDVNERFGKKFFEPNAYFATAIGQRRLIDYIQAATFRKKVLTNPNFAQKFEKGMETPSNAVVIDTNKYTFLKEGGDLLDGMVKETVGGEYVVTKAVKQALDRFQSLNTDEGTKAMLQALDGAQGMWKKLALFSPGYHVRNFMGNLWNSYLIGMRPDQLVRYTNEATDELIKATRGNESKLFNEFRQQGLLMSGQTKVEMKPFSEPEKAIEKAVKKLSKTGPQKTLDRLTSPLQTSREIGENADAVNRFALYKWARDKGMDPKQAAEKVRTALFDYDELTQFERNVMKRIMPFYTWSRKNIPYQLNRFMEHPEKFQRLNYLRQNAQENVGISEENIPDFMKENFYMPVFGKEGKGRMLSLNLPAGDLTKLRDPLKIGADLLTPLVKTPLELSSNYNLFKRKPIQRFEGQEKKFSLGGLDFGIPIKTAYGLEQLTGQVGRGLSTMLQDDSTVDQENKFMNPSLGIGSFLKPFDAEQFDYFKKLDERKKLQDLILYIEQQEGVKPRTVAEIRRGR